MELPASSQVMSTWWERERKREREIVNNFTYSRTQLYLRGWIRTSWIVFSVTNLSSLRPGTVVRSHWPSKTTLLWVTTSHTNTPQPYPTSCSYDQSPTLCRLVIMAVVQCSWRLPEAKSQKELTLVWPWLIDLYTCIRCPLSLSLSLSSTPPWACCDHVWNSICLHTEQNTKGSFYVEWCCTFARQAATRSCDCHVTDYRNTWLVHLSKPLHFHPLTVLSIQCSTHPAIQQLTFGGCVYVPHPGQICGVTAPVSQPTTHTHTLVICPPPLLLVLIICSSRCCH